MNAIRVFCWYCNQEYAYLDGGCWSQTCDCEEPVRVRVRLIPPASPPEDD